MLPQDDSEPPPPSTLAWRKDASAADRAWYDVHLLIEKLSAIEKRLGSFQEDKTDFLHARALGHAIQNKLTFLQLYDDLKALAVRPGDITDHPTPHE